MVRKRAQNRIRRLFLSEWKNHACLSAGNSGGKKREMKKKTKQNWIQKSKTVGSCGTSRILCVRDVCFTRASGWDSLLGKPVTHHDDSSATIGRPREFAGAYKVMMRRRGPPGHCRGGRPDRGHGYARHSAVAAAATATATMTSTNAWGTKNAMIVLFFYFPPRYWTAGCTTDETPGTGGRSVRRRRVMSPPVTGWCRRTVVPPNWPTAWKMCVTRSTRPGVLADPAAFSGLPRKPRCGCLDARLRVPITTRHRDCDE